jgi:hypothetical protein
MGGSRENMFRAGYDAPPNCGMASGDGPLQSIRCRATDQGPNTRGTAKYRQEIIEHLEKALALRGRAREPVVDYLVVPWMRREARTETVCAWLIWVALLAEVVR